MVKHTHHYLRYLAYLSAFVLSISMAFPSYFNAEFLNRFVSERTIGLIFAVSSVLTMIGITYLPRLLRLLGIAKTTTILAVINILLVIPLVWPMSKIFTIIFFILYYGMGFLLRYNLDLYLEDISDHKDAGDVHGIYMTAVNLAWLVSPLLASFIISTGSFTGVYAFSALMLVPLVYIAAFCLTEYIPNEAKETHMIKAAASLVIDKTRRAKNLFNILVVDFLLNFFYAIMVVYTAMYLTHNIGLTTAGIGIAFTIMLIPFVIFELPLGWLADHVCGEQEILIMGFYTAAIFTGAMSFIHTNNIWIWAIVLFMTRTGICAVEIMKETYLFKKIDGHDTDILSISRNMQPISYIAGPIVASLFISSFGLQYIFLALGIITILGIIPASLIKDTK